MYSSPLFSGGFRITFISAVNNNYYDFRGIYFNKATFYLSSMQEINCHVILFLLRRVSFDEMLLVILACDSLEEESYASVCAIIYRRTNLF